MLAYLQSHPALTEALVLLLWLAAAAFVLHVTKPVGHYKAPKHGKNRNHYRHQKI